MKEISFDEKPASEEVRRRISDEISGRFPFVKRYVLSKSAAGRDIEAFRLGNEDSACLLTAAYHGMEWLTSLVSLKFLYKLAERVKESDISICKALTRRGVTFVPCVNPDGVEISLKGAEAAGPYEELVRAISPEGTDSWQANARGVDINHNFDAGWRELHKLEIESGIIGPAETRYGGIEPESEPETKAITSLCREKYFTHALALHSQGEEIYWEYGGNAPGKSKILAQRAAELSGYKLSEPEGLAVGGGFKDWFITELKRPAFTMEIGKGKNPLPVSDFASVYAKLEETLLFIVTA